MAKKITKTGNFFVVRDTIKESDEINHPAKDTYFINNDGVFRFYRTNDNQELGESAKGYDLGATKPTGTVTLTGESGTKAEGTITLASVSAGVFSTATVTLDTAVAGDTVTINGLTYTGVEGEKANNTQFSVDTDDDTAAADLEDSINNDERTGLVGTVSADTTDNVVTVTSNVLGLEGDTTPISSSDEATLAVTEFDGGAEPDTVTVNGLVYTAVVGAKANDTQFSIDTDDDTAAADLADSIDDDTRVGTLYDVTASATDNVVTVTSTVSGTPANAITLASSNGTRLDVSAATLEGGANDALISGIEVDEVEVMSGSVVYVDSLAQTAANVSANINAHTSDPNYTATSNGAVVSISSLNGGEDDNGLVVVSTVVEMTKTDGNLAGGTTNFTDTSDAVFENEAAVVTFLRANLGAE